MTDGIEYQLPDHPVLAQYARALQDSRHWAFIIDPDLRVVFVTDDYRSIISGLDGLGDFGVGEYLFSAEIVEISRKWRYALTTDERWTDMLESCGGMILAGLPGGRERLEQIVAPVLKPVVASLKPMDVEAGWFPTRGSGQGGTSDIDALVTRIRDDAGALIGTVMLLKPRAAMTIMGVAMGMADQDHLQRSIQMARASRRQAAILFADLEHSSDLARQMPTAAYFNLIRRLVRSADAAIIAAGGLVGRHVGDGVVAFFPAAAYPSESAAARGCIEAARAIREAMPDIAARSELDTTQVAMRFGLHWGSKLYIGSITSGGRSEIAALGDEANEASRIEACASGARTLASKDLIERLDREDAKALDLDPDHTKYERLDQLQTATDKARRDAPAIAVTEV